MIRSIAHARPWGMGVMPGGGYIRGYLIRIFGRKYQRFLRCSCFPISLYSFPSHSLYLCSCLSSFFSTQSLFIRDPAPESPQFLSTFEDAEHFESSYAKLDSEQFMATITLHILQCIQAARPTLRRFWDIKYFEPFDFLRQVVLWHLAVFISQSIIKARVLLQSYSLYFSVSV